MAIKRYNQPTPEQARQIRAYEYELEQEQQQKLILDAEKGVLQLQSIRKAGAVAHGEGGDALADTDAMATAPPTSNRGGLEKILDGINQKIDWDQFQQNEYFSHWLTDSKGRILEVPLRRGRKDGAFIDYLTFTASVTSIYDRINLDISDKQTILRAFSEIFHSIFGFGIFEKKKGKGKYFYEEYYQLGPDNAEYGTFHIGGQNGTFLIDLKGTGCQASKPGWEVRLFQFLKNCQNPKITRIDLAYDFFDGEYTPQQAYNDHENGLFDNGLRRPKKETRGAGWHTPEYLNDGLTLYVGSRQSGKLLRIYEKGKQLGDKESKWVRFEVEFRKADSVLLLDMLVNSGLYLAGAYPVGADLFKSEMKRIDTAIKQVNINFDKLEKYARQQVGRMINFMLELGIPPEQICQRLKAEDGLYPKGLRPEEYSYDKVNVKYIHQLGYSIDPKDYEDDFISETATDFNPN